MIGREAGFVAAVMIGVDPRKGSHAAVVVGAAGEQLGKLRVRASAEQAQQLLAWAAAWPERTWAVEGPRPLAPSTPRSACSARPPGTGFGNLEINAFGTFIITSNRRAQTEDLIIQRGWTGLDAEAIWQMPTIFIGSLDQIRSDLRERRERFGLSYLVAGEDALPVLAEIASGL
jgi:hypothetical protein